MTFSRNTQRKKNLKAFSHSLIAEAILRDREHTSCTDSSIPLQRVVDFKTFPVVHIGIHRCFLLSSDPLVRRNFLLLISQLAPHNTAQRCFSYNQLCYYDTQHHSFIFLLGSPQSLFFTPICLCGKYQSTYRVVQDKKYRSSESGIRKQHFAMNEVRACLTLRRYTAPSAFAGMLRQLQSQKPPSAAALLKRKPSEVPLQREKHRSKK